MDDSEIFIMTTPLIIQIQETALDSKASLTDALRKAKLACVKLNLEEFQEWIDLELNGYVGKTVDEIPDYRRLNGILQGHNPFHGWQPIRFSNSDVQKLVRLQ